MAKGIHLQIYTPGRKVLDTEVDRVEIPALDGEIGVLPGHTELVSLLKPAGLLTYHSGDSREEIAISDGFFEVSPGAAVLRPRLSASGRMSASSFLATWVNTMPWM